MMAGEDMKLIQGETTEGYGNQEINELMDRISQDMEKLRERLPLPPSSYFADASLPWMWGRGDGKKGERPTDPLTLYFWLRTEDDSENFTWAKSLSELVDDVVENHVLRDGTVSAESYATCLGPIADALMAEAHKLMAYNPTPTT